MRIAGIVFAPDGEHVFFRRWESGTVAAIFRVPTLGGNIKRIVEDADSEPTFSPDGQRIAFRRGIPGRGVALMVAKIDGSDQRELAIGDGMGWPSWSPDGRTIAATLLLPEGVRLFAFDVESGTRHVLSGDVLFTQTTGIAWLPDGEHLIVAGQVVGGNLNHQIWSLSATAGTLRRITNDPNDYLSVSLSADGKVLATVLNQRVGHLYAAPANALHDLRQLTWGSRERVGSVDTDGTSVVFLRAPDGQKWEMWACEGDGSNLRRIEIGRLEIDPAFSGVSAAGGVIMFAARGEDGHYQIWRVDEENSLPAQVTATENNAYGPSLSPDGSWFTYSELPATGAAGMGGLGASVWRQQVRGGPPVLLAPNAAWGEISPDGQKIALQVEEENEQGLLDWFLEVMSADGEKQLFGASTGGRPHWKPDGHSLTYFGIGRDVQLWLQPLDGGPPQQLTHFENGRVVSHAWSPDGNWLYLVLEETTSDAVLIRNF
jgi:Tol biopolymer transport system component